MRQPPPRHQKDIATREVIPKRANSNADRGQGPNYDNYPRRKEYKNPKPKKNTNQLAGLLGFGPMPGNKTIPGETRWNLAEANDLWHLAHRHPAAVDRLEAFRSMTMCKPFHLRIGKRHTPKKTWKPAPMQPMMEEIVQTNFMDFLYDVTVWVACFGICPYFLEPIRGTAHFRPWVPVFGSGYVTTFIEEKTHKQRFRWWWTHGQGAKPEIDETVGWITDGNPPMLNGSFRSPLSSVLEDYRHYLYAMRDNQYASYHSTHPSAVITFDPKHQQTDDESITQGLFGEAISKELMYEDEEAAQEMHSFKATSLKRALGEAGMVHGLAVAEARQWEGPVMDSESHARQFAREHNGFYNRRVLIPPNFAVAKGPDHKAVIDLEKWDAILSAKISEVLGVPSEMDKTSQGQKAANKEGIKLSVGERVKRRIIWIEWVAEQVFLDIYGDTLQRGFNSYLNKDGSRYYRPRVHTRKRGRETLRETAVDSILSAYSDVRVELHCTPLLNEAMALELYDRDFLDEEYMMSYLTDRYGFPESAVKRPKHEAGYDAKLELQAQQQKFQQEMAMREFKLKEKMQREEMALKRKIQEDKTKVEQEKIKAQKESAKAQLKAAAEQPNGQPGDDANSPAQVNDNPADDADSDDAQPPKKKSKKTSEKTDKSAKE